MGYCRLVTYTLTTESGASLRGAGWKVLHTTKNGHNDWAAKEKATGNKQKRMDMVRHQQHYSRHYPHPDV